MTHEEQPACNRRRAITAPCALYQSSLSDTTVMVSTSGEVIVRWFGRLAGSSGVWAGGLSATALLTLVALMGRGNDPPGSRTQVDSVVGGLSLGTWFIRGCAWTTKKIFLTLREKTTEGFSSGWCG